MASRINWRGDAVKKKLAEASKRAVNEVMAECVLESKQNHPGWQNRTETAEGSVRVVAFAEQKTARRVAGRWGSIGVNYVIWLELKHGSFLRNAATKIYPSLATRVRANLG